MKKFFLIGIGLGLLGVLGVLLVNDTSKFEIVSPLVSFKKTQSKIENKYSPYTFENLSRKEFKEGEIKLGAATRFEKNYTTYIFTYKSDDKTISGMANLPFANASFDSSQDKQGKPQKFPVIILLRGYSDRETYYIGSGTEKQANYYADQGFLTLAPDFLGYGYSDWEDQDILLARFYRPVEVLSLIASIESLPQAESQKIGLWAHSNGGQIALSVLEITGKAYPTSLWAPVSLGFPQSVLVYLGEPEVGNIVKEKIDEFSKENDPKKYSISEYFSRIKAPVIIHQGMADELIKTSWTQNLVNQLKSQGLGVEYYSYPGLNHNFNNIKNAAEILRQRDAEFFKNKLKN